MSQLTAKMEKWARKGLIGVSALALCMAPMVGPAAARAKVGVASAVIPQARLGDTLNDLEVIAVGDRVDQDVLIETGKRGRTQVLFVDGSSMNIGPSSRIVIDEFVFDPAQLSGNLGARIEKGSMRFIGGVLSKRANQVKFNAGEATVGIRGGIAKIALGGDGKLKAELVHGRLSVATPEGIFETDRIGTLIERDVEGDVVTRSVTVEEAKEELDEEAKENIVEPEAEEPTTDTAGDDTNAPTQDGSEETATDAGDDAAEADPGDTPLDAGAADTGEPVNEDEAAAPSATPAAANDAEDGAVAGADEQKVTGDVLVDDPVDTGLVQIGADGKLEATAELAEIDPDAAKLINEGGVAVDESGQIVPTAKMLELDPTAQAMFDEGLLEVDENGFLVPSQDYDPDGFYEDVSFEETDDKQVSDATLKEFGFEEVQALNDEDAYKANLSATRAVLKADETTAKLYEVGQLEIDENGLLKPSADFDPLLAARAEQTVQREQITFVDDNAADKLLLNTGVFDTKITTRVVGTDLASDLYSTEVTQVVSADIVRDDALNAITKLAAANGLSLPDNIDEKELDDLVALGGALSTRDALKASVGVTSVDYNEPVAEVDVGDDGKVVLRTIGVDGKVEETDAEAALIDLVTGSIDIETAGKFISEEELVRLLPVAGGQADDTKQDDSAASNGAVKDNDAGSTRSAIESRLIAAIEAGDGKLPGVDDVATLDPIDFIDAAKGEEGIADFIGDDGKIDTGGFDDKTVFVPTIDAETKVDDIIDLGKSNFVGGLSDEFVKEAATRSPSIEIVDRISLIADETGGLAKVALIENDKDEPDQDIKDDLVTRQVEDEKNEQAEKIAAEQANTVIESAVISMAGQRLAKNSVWGSGSALYWTAYSSAGLEPNGNEDTPQNELRLLGDGQMTLGLASAYQGDDGEFINGFGTPIVAMGEATALLAAHNVTFKNTVDAVLLSRTSTNTVSQNFVSNRPEVLQARSPVEICSCDQVATGLWTTEDFTDRALGNLSYQHQSHWAIGAPLSSDTIRSLAGMMASFEGHAYGTVANAAGVKEGFGEVVVGLDFANPNDMTRNVFALENFDAANLNEPISVSVPLTQGRDANGVFDGRYVGRGGNVRIDGGVHGTVDNLQTAGTFALNAPGDLAISGSYAARGTAVESVSEPSSVTIVSRTR